MRNYDHMRNRLRLPAADTGNQSTFSKTEPPKARGGCWKVVVEIRNFEKSIHIFIIDTDLRIQKTNV